MSTSTARLATSSPPRRPICGIRSRAVTLQVPTRAVRGYSRRMTRACSRTSTRGRGTETPGLSHLCTKSVVLVSLQAKPRLRARKGSQRIQPECSNKALSMSLAKVESLITTMGSLQIPLRSASSGCSGPRSRSGSLCRTSSITRVK